MSTAVAVMPSNEPSTLLLGEFGQPVTVDPLDIPDVVDMIEDHQRRCPWCDSHGACEVLQSRVRGYASAMLDERRVMALRQANGGRSLHRAS